VCECKPPYVCSWHRELRKSPPKLKACAHLVALREYMDREQVSVWGESDMGSVPDHYACARCKIEAPGYDLDWDE